jgi:hypothetical protein
MFFYISPLLTDISVCLQRDCSISFESDRPRWCRNEEKTPIETPEVFISGNYRYLAVQITEPQLPVFPF